MRAILIAMILFSCLGAAPAFAAEGGNEFADVGDVILVFLVLSVVFEVALTPLFNWRVYMAHLEGKGYKTPITVALAFIVFWGYGLDIISDLLNALGEPTEKSVGGQILTALLIAGGSSGVFQIFTKLKIRMEPEERRAKTEESRQAMTKKRSDTRTSGRGGG